MIWLMLLMLLRLPSIYSISEVRGVLTELGRFAGGGDS